MPTAQRVFWAAALGAAILTTGVNAFAAETLYESKTREEVCRGVTFEANTSVTDAGILDIHVLTVDLTDPDISIKPVESGRETGLKETVSSLLRESGAIAGVNANFFGEDGAYSAGFGAVVRDGQLISVSGDTNSNGNEFASFLLTRSGDPFISFIKTGIHFYNNGAENIEVHSINKITDMVYPVIVTGQAMKDTAELDSRFPGLLKVVVSGQRITYVSRQGETVAVPDGGYVLVIQQASADYFGKFFRAGQRAVLQIEPEGVDFGNIETAVGGGGLILQDGQPVTMGVVVSADKREPRTAIGLNRDNTRLIIVQADGRAGLSIGANQDDMIAIMQRYGAYNAMHLDGGGSSTMVIKDTDNGYNVVNGTSDGVERKVVDALGIFSVAPVEYRRLRPPAEVKALPLAELRVQPGELRMAVGDSARLSFTGVDVAGGRTEITSGVAYEVYPPAMGTVSDGVFTAADGGIGMLKCSIGGVYAYTPIYVGDTGGLQVMAPDQPRFRDPMCGEPGGALGYPSVVYQGETVFDEAERAPVVYSAARYGRCAVLTMTGANGGLLAADPDQWRRFKPDIDGMNPSCIVIQTDVSPLNYSQPKEFDLFHAALAEYQAKGIQVFVVSKQGLETSTVIKDGIRYINLGAMWKDASTENENYRVFRLYTLGDTFTYTLTIN